jgi:hypothetical protein
MKRQPIGRLVGIAVVIAFFLAACSGISPSGAVSSATPERAVSGATAPAALSPTATQAMPSATPTEPAATATQMIPSAPSGAPAQVRLITSDIDRFWAAYDRATLAGSVSRFVFIRKITWRAPALGFAILRRRASRTPWPWLLRSSRTRSIMRPCGARPRAWRNFGPRSSKASRT